MRASLACLVVAAASAGACVVGTLAQAQDAQRAGPAVVSEETAKDVEVMRRVLVREAIAGRVNVSGEWNYEFLVSDRGASVSEAFVVAGQGGTIVLRTSDAVSAGRGADDAAPGADKPSAWDEEAAALEGKVSAAKPRRRANRYDAAKVDALKGRVLDALAKYGQKIRGLGASERIVVIVVGGNGGNGLFYEPQIVSSNEDGKTALRTVLATTARGGELTVLTMSVAVGDCQAAASGSMNAEEFKRRAVVAGY